MGEQAGGGVAGVSRPTLIMSARRRWAVTAGVMTGMFLAALEATVVGTAMPTVIASLGGLNHYSWVFSAYLITSTITVPVWGKLSDLYGRRLLFQIGIAVFLLGSVLSGMAETMTQLIVFRAVQGLGAGALVPLGMTIIGDVYTVEERARMQAFFSGVWGISSVVGPVVGGFITDQLSWRWVFYINVPFGILAAVIMQLSLKEPRRHGRPSIDYAGATLLMASITLLMLALVEGGATLGEFASARNVALLMGAIVLGVLLIIGGRLLLKVGYRPTTLAGLFLLTLGFALLSSYQRTTPRIWLYVDLVLIGAGLGLTMLTLLIAVQQSVGRAQLGIATSLNQFSRSIGGAVGVAIMGAVLSAGLASHLQSYARAGAGPLTPERAAELASNPNALIDPQASAALPPEVLDELRESLASAIHNVFWTGTVLSGLALVVAFWLPREGDAGVAPPDEETCGAETGERMVLAEFTTLEAEEEPVASK